MSETNVINEFNNLMRESDTVYNDLCIIVIRSLGGEKISFTETLNHPSQENNRWLLMVGKTKYPLSSIINITKVKV